MTATMPLKNEFPGILANPRSTNSKTGDIPSLTLLPPDWADGVASREEAAEAGKAALRKTCEGCPLLKRGSKPLCYAHYGSVMMGMKAKLKASWSNPGEHTLEYALRARSVSAKYVRVGDVGDPWVVGRRVWNRAARLTRGLGLGVLAFTHFWASKGAWMKGEAMASCDSIDEADRAVASGWRAVAVVPSEWPPGQRSILTPAGNRAIVCPAMISKVRRVALPTTCNSCGLCDAHRPGPIILFPDHGASSQGTPWRRRG